MTEAAMADGNDDKRGRPESRDGIRHPSDQHRRQFPKNLALMLVLAAVSVLFYVIAIVRMGGG